MRQTAAMFRDGTFEDATIIAIAQEEAETPMLALLARYERQVADGAQAVRETRKELMLALRRAKNRKEG
jgi:hypothetical protein